MALDRQFLIDNIWFGYGKPATSALSSNFAATGLYAEGMPNYPANADPDAANKLLDEAGIAPDAMVCGRRPCLISSPMARIGAAPGEYMKQALGDIGIELELRYEDVPTWLKRSTPTTTSR